MLFISASPGSTTLCSSWKPGLKFGLTVDNFLDLATFETVEDWEMVRKNVLEMFLKTRVKKKNGHI